VSDPISGPSSSTVSAAASTSSSAGTYSDSLTGQDKAGNHAAISCPYTVKAAPPVNRFLVGDQAGTVAFRDRCCGGGGTGSTETSKSSTLTSLPATWATGSQYSDGPFSAYGYATN
jgi:hypothetical protein